MLVGTINIAMQATTAALQRGLNDARGALGGFAKQVLSLKGLVTGAFAGVGLGALQHFASLADDLSDNVERLGTMFGESASVVVAQSELMNKAFGTSEITFTSMATKMGGLFKALGVAEAPAAEMTNQLLTLGQAIANFKGISLEAAMGKVQAGMMGKGKALKEFGIDVKATMSVQERFNALMSGGAGVIGAMSTRAMDAGASWASLRGRIEQVEISIGQNLPEMVEPFFAELNVLVVAATELFKGLNNETLNWGQQSLSSAKGAAEGIGWVQNSVGALANAWQLVSAAFHTVRASFTNFLSYAVSGLSKLIKGIDWVLRQLGLVGEGEGANVTGFLDAWADNMGQAAQKEMDKVRENWAKPWSSEGINAAFDSAKEKINTARKEVTKSALGAITPATPKAAATSIAKSAGAALSVGSAEATSAFIRTKYGIGDEGHQKKMEKYSEAMVKGIDNINKNLEAGNGDPEMMADF